MTARVRMPLTLLALVLSACLIAASAEAQEAAPALATEGAGEEAQVGGQEEEEGFWDGIVSSFVDFFGGSSEEAAEARESGDVDAGEKEKGLPEGPDRARNTRSNNAQEGHLEAGRTDAVASQPNRRPSPRQAVAGGDGITPSHVYRATVDLVSEIAILRDAMNVTGRPRKAPLPEHRAPVHVYAKALEVLEKTARFQKRLGMIPAEVGHMPVSPVSQGDLHRGVRAVIEELRRVKRQLVVGDEIEPATLAGGKTSSLTYRNLAHASMLLDGLVGRPTSPNDLYRQMMRVHNEMLLVADGLGVSLVLDPPAVEGGKEPVALALQVGRAANKVIDLQKRLGMDAPRPLRIALDDVATADVFDAINFLLAELARIKAHLDVRLPGSGPHEARNKTTEDVFARVLLVIRNLHIMNKATEDAG